MSRCLILTRNTVNTIYFYCPLYNGVTAQRILVPNVLDNTLHVQFSSAIVENAEPTPQFVGVSSRVTSFVLRPLRTTKGQGYYSNPGHPRYCT